jgi:hypothetical protein
MQAYSSPILLVLLNVLLSAWTKTFLRFAGTDKETEPQYEFSHSLQRRDSVKNTRWQIVRNGMSESLIFDLNTLPQDRQKYPLSCALMHTSGYEIVFPTLDPFEDRKQLQTYYLSVKATNHPVV